MPPRFACERRSSAAERPSTTASTPCGSFGSHWARCARSTLGSIADGVDAEFAAAVRAESGALGFASGSMTATTAGLATIVGTRGQVQTLDHFVFPSRLSIMRGQNTETWVDPSGVTGRDGLVWQAVALAQYASEGVTESPLHSLDDTIALATALDIVRADLRIPSDPGESVG